MVSRGKQLAAASAVLAAVVFWLFISQLATVRAERLAIDASGPPAHRVAVEAELADSFLKQQVGLTSERSIPERYGMLMVFPEEARRFFRAKDYQFPLDVLFFDSTGRVIAIATLEPCRSSICPYADSIEPARALLLVNAGFAARNGVREGDRALLPAA